ncbi:MAG: hypothetical protein AOA65_1878 [Candidatus Bathyarchaeota archaeon BA1]|nr:MAG: hypothetical protein AOA65_1878 [Candidatus Bathyarchaeota archaeon BA1]
MKILMALDEAAKNLEKALEEARTSKLEGEPFFTWLAESYARLFAAVALMRAYGRLDPQEGETLKARLFKA